MHDLQNLFEILYPLIKDDAITDIRWNGRSLWIDDLKKGRYQSDLELSDVFLQVFTTRVAAMMNVNFNVSYPSLQASIHNLRIHALHPSITSDEKYVLAIRKIPAFARINDQNAIKSKYMNECTQELLKALIQSHCSGIIIGDTGSGKTELQKYLASFLPDEESCLTVEDTLEMKLPILYPQKDISAIKIDAAYTAKNAIKDALRLLVRYLWIAESRGEDIHTILEGASTGCCAWTTIHTSNVWEIPDRIAQMANTTNIENDFFTFFDVGIKVDKSIQPDGIYRQISQICFFERQNKENRMYIWMKDGKIINPTIPKSIKAKFIHYKQWKIFECLERDFTWKQ